jgi:hypothetical protein
MMTRVKTPGSTNQPLHHITQPASKQAMGGTGTGTPEYFLLAKLRLSISSPSSLKKESRYKRFFTRKSKRKKKEKKNHQKIMLITENCAYRQHTKGPVVLSKTKQTV